MSKHTELKRLAEIARDNCPIWYAEDCFSLRHMDGGDSSYVEAASPLAILDLFAENEALLEALENMVTTYEYEASSENTSLLAARAAIAKARGEA